MEILHCYTRKKQALHDVRRERKQGKVPGILYGKSISNLMFEIAELELNKEIMINGEHGILNIDLDGQNHTTVIKEIQKDPVTHKVIHIDLEEVNRDSVITTDIPIIFIGEDNVIKSGGIIQKEKNSIKIQCKGSNIPKYINVDLSKLHVGDTYRISDIEVAQEISFIEDINSIIASITKGNTRDIAPSVGNEKVDTQSNNKE